MSGGGGVLEGYIKAPIQGLPELLPEYISPILGSGQDSGPPTALSGPSQFLFGILSQIFLQGPQLPLLRIHPPLLPRLKPFPYLSGM